MSVQVLCPSCGNVRDIHRPPAGACGRCGAELPSAMQRSVNQALTESRAPKPVLLTLGQWLSIVGGLVLLLFLILAPFSIGTYRINDEVVTGPEFLRRAGWMFAVYGPLLLAIGGGLWRDREWTRPLMVLYWLSLAILYVFFPGQGVGDMAGGVATSLGSAAVAAWYLYRKPNVRAYFEARTP